MSGADRLEDGFPHGTTQGYADGCRGGWCPAGNDHGLSCSRAKQLSAGDYQYQRLAKQGRSPAEIAFELGLAPETHVAPQTKPTVSVADDEEVTDLEGDEEPMNHITKPARPVPVPPTASGRTKAELAEIRQWAKDNGVPHTVTGRMPRATIAAYDAAHAASEAQAVEAPKPTQPRKLPPTMIANVSSGISRPADPVRILSEKRTAQAAFEFVLQKWGEESRRRRAQSALLRSMARQVILAEQERRYDAELLAAMDTALAEAYERIAQLTAELAARPEPWWKWFAS